MDDNAKHAASYQVDQEILEARGINMTVEEVAGLPTCKYSERVQSLKLTSEDLAFLKGLRRRIKNRLASQNSRRRSVEHLRRLNRELRAARACRNEALADRRALVERRDSVRDKCALLRRHLVQILEDRSDPTEVPCIAVVPSKTTFTNDVTIIKLLNTPQRKSPISHLSDCFRNGEPVNHEIEFEDDKGFIRELKDIRAERDKELKEIKTERDKEFKAMKTERVRHEPQGIKMERDMSQSDVERYTCDIKNELNTNVFECQIGKLVQQSVNHIFNDKKKVFAKTVFIANELTSNVKSITIDNNEVLNLSVKEGRRKSHGRKQSAPRRITYCALNDDGVLDLKIKKESQ